MEGSQDSGRSGAANVHNALKTEKQLAVLSAPQVTAPVQSPSLVFAKSHAAQCIDAWVISDGFASEAVLGSEVQQLGINCTKVLRASALAPSMTDLLTVMRKEQPGLVWIALPDRPVENFTARYHTRVRVIVEEQLRASRHVVVEGVVTNASAISSGFLC